jgi:hypothetical protein
MFGVVGLSESSPLSGMPEEGECGYGAAELMSKHVLTQSLNRWL